MMPIDPSAWAITPALVHAIMTPAAPSEAAMSIFLSGPEFFLSFYQDRIGQRLEHLHDPRIVGRAVIDVAVDGLEPSLQIAARQAGHRSVDHEIHFARGGGALPRHEVTEPRHLH